MTAGYVTDTHSLLWHLFIPKRVGQRARAIFAEADAGRVRIYIPAVVIAEALMVAQKERLPGVTPPLLLPHFEAIRGSDNYQLCPLLPETVLRSTDLSTIPDIFDRLIAAEALVRGVPVITRDPALRDADLISTIWD